jgi:hypothetical protein
MSHFAPTGASELIRIKSSHAVYAKQMADLRPSQTLFGQGMGDSVDVGLFEPEFWARFCRLAKAIWSRFHFVTPAPGSCSPILLLRSKPARMARARLSAWLKVVAASAVSSLPSSVH